MKSRRPVGVKSLLQVSGLFFVTTILLSGPAASSALESPKNATPRTISWSELEARAMALYSGDGFAVTPTERGARLHCGFQRLDGEATREGLWLTSTVTDASKDRFCVVASAVGRGAVTSPLSRKGDVFVDAQTVRFVRRGLIEEYSASIDGVRQEFVVLEKPDGEGELRVQLTVAGARAEPVASGVQLVLENSGRKIAYSRLRVTDARGRKLSARLEASKGTKIQYPQSETGLAVVVDDLDAIYPLRIDPTFSDANWVSLNSSIPGADNYVYAAVPGWIAQSLHRRQFYSGWGCDSEQRSEMGWK